MLDGKTLEIFLNIVLQHQQIIYQSWVLVVQRNDNIDKKEIFGEIFGEMC